MIHRALLLAAVLFVLGASNVRAGVIQEPPPSPPIHLPMIESLEPVAEAYWMARGISLPLPVEVFLAATSPEMGGLADLSGRRLWLTQETVELRGLSGRSFMCMIYLHERGHNAGLVHNSGDPIMAANPWLGLSRVVPKCFTWAETGFHSALLNTFNH